MFSKGGDEVELAVGCIVVRAKRYDTRAHRMGAPHSARHAALLPLQVHDRADDIQRKRLCAAKPDHGRSGAGNLGLKIQIEQIRQAGGAVLREHGMDLHRVGAGCQCGAHIARRPYAADGHDGCLALQL